MPYLLFFVLVYFGMRDDVLSMLTYSGLLVAVHYFISGVVTAVVAVIDQIWEAADEFLGNDEYGNYTFEFRDEKCKGRAQ